MSCPICGGQDLVSILGRERLPVMQQVVYPTREQALASASAPFELAGCRRCEFMFNSRFDGALMSYDVGYDNHVESRTFREYYDSLARMLTARFGLDAGGIVYDIGCGQGTFLKNLCAVTPKVRGVGIDPSCEPMASENLTLMRARFSPALIDQDAKLILLRHVLEHIDRPIDFLTALREAAGTVPVFVEVPDATWIFENRAFWDFCYEHCNYFVPDSLAAALHAAGFVVAHQERSFQDQYQWAICGPEPAAAELKPSGEARAPQSVEAALRYGAAERGYLDRVTAQVTEAADRGSCVLWGMATKGVVLASLLPPGRLAAGIDSNVRKQGRFAPGSGLSIQPPSRLSALPGPVTAFVMNRNYYSEIQGQVRALGLDVELRSI